MISGFRCKYNIDANCEADKCDKCTNHPMYQQGRAEVVNELLTIENPCDNCYMEFCESCNHNGEYAFKISKKLEQLKEQKE